MIRKALEAQVERQASPPRNMPIMSESQPLSYSSLLYPNLPSHTLLYTTLRYNPLPYPTLHKPTLHLPTSTGILRYPCPPNVTPLIIP